MPVLVSDLVRIYKHESDTLVSLINIKIMILHIVWHLRLVCPVTSTDMIMPSINTIELMP